MTARRWLSAVALMILSAGAGCQSWCSRHYPCQQQGYYGYAPPPAPAYPAAGQCCVPCCPPNAGYTPPVPQPPQPPQPNWGGPCR